MACSVWNAMVDCRLPRTASKPALRHSRASLTVNNCLAESTGGVCDLGGETGGGGGVAGSVKGKADDMGLLRLFVTASVPVMKVLLVTGVGSFLATGNLGNMLLIIVPAICKERGSPFGAPDVCTTYGLAYSSLSMAIGAVFLWSIVYNIVRISAGATDGKANACSDTQEQQIIEETEKLVPQSCLDRTLPIEHTNLPGDECVLTFSASKISQNELKVSFSDKARHLLSNILKIIDLKRLFAPSTIGVIIGFIIGVVPHIRKALIGETAPLRVIQESADLLGEGAIPTLTLIMGGNLLKGILVVKGAINLGLLHQDPLYHFILLLQYALPPAMNIGTITQLFGAGESECSVIFLWTYSLASVALTLWSTYFMWLVSTN
ncbi:Membrane transport protein [Musa troglodytarum]|uniref:Membrane transport protein n=1 Tax=Musa troglodytarum TaxID=320322 RepID=A0A9E7JTN7_9LILI|nr:Membrane transport protein [Musa troglodytarum]